jgi:hypothetical protein
MDWRCLRSSHDVERDSLMCIAAEAFHFEIAKPRIDRFTERRRRLRRSLKAKHALVPCDAGQPIRFPTGLGSALCRRAD